MQDIHSIGGGGGRLFGGGGDRRVRPLHHQSNQALKCPRCDSANTKFCYYNNYNLSQPRHFCKSCRRYWTKGGVLRNVPVGGGCRKAKRSKTKASSSDAPPKEKKSNSHSSSESSSLTASNTAAPTASTAATGGAAPEVASGSCSTSASPLLNFPNSVFFSIPQSTSLGFDPPSLIDHSSEGRIFQEIGSFTSLMTSATDQSQLGFEAADASASGYRLNPDPEDPNTNDDWGKHQKIAMVEEMKMQAGGGFLDQTAEIDLSGFQSRGSNCGGGLGALDWQGGGGTDHGIFDLSGTVDQAYWSQTQWTDNDQSLYLP